MNFWIGTPTPQTTNSSAFRLYAYVPTYSLLLFLKYIIFLYYFIYTQNIHLIDTCFFNQNTNSKPAETVGCTIARSTIIAKAKVWVANHVPYNQGGTYQGYREDCSGTPPLLSPVPFSSPPPVDFPPIPPLLFFISLIFFQDT